LTIFIGDLNAVLDPIIAGLELVAIAHRGRAGFSAVLQVPMDLELVLDAGRPFRSA
jgi:hypothetical protein